MSHDRIRIVQIGCGTWGRNILRSLMVRRDTEVRLVIDPSADARASASALAPGARLACDLDALHSMELDAAVIATPAPLHARHALACMDEGLHVLVEKPLATASSDARTLVERRRQNGVIGMVGHLLRYHPACAAMIAFARSGCLGAPRCLRSSRFSTLASQSTDGSLLWALGPHDVSLILALDPQGIRHLRARTGRIGTPLPGEDNIAILRLQTATMMRAVVALSRASPQKIRTVTVECEEGTLVFDDLLSRRKVCVTQTVHGKPRVRTVSYNENVEPLQAELDAFLASIRSGIAPLTSLEEGLAVVDVLVKASQDAAQAAGVQSAQWAGSDLHDW